MNKARLLSEKQRLEEKRRQIDNELSPVLDGLKMLEILEKVIDECDNGAGHYYKELWTDRNPSGDTESRLLMKMANDGLVRIKDYDGKTVSMKDHRGSSARFTVTPLGRSVLAESEGEAV